LTGGDARQSIFSDGCTIALFLNSKRRFRLMKNQRMLTVLTLFNAGVLIFLVLNQIRPVEASSPTSVLRGSGLEIVDAQGKVRASIQIVPPGPARGGDGSVVKDGKVYPEAVLFRLIRPDGRPSVKIETTEQGSGLDLGGGIDPTYIVLTASGGDASLTLTNKDGRRQLIKP
jgi:hypothetical protein